MAADLEALLDGLAIDRIPVVGFSMGGFIAQALRSGPAREEPNVHGPIRPTTLDVPGRDRDHCWH